MIELWTWFVGTRIGRWLVGLGVLLAALGAMALAMFEKGKRTQAAKDQAKDAEAAQRAAQAAQDTFTAASNAAAKVQAAAAKQPPPDPIKRDDFNGTF